MTIGIGVVIPALNEQAMIGRALETLGQRGRPRLVVVADCGSRDRTVEIAARHGAVVTGGPDLSHRAAALAAGLTCALRHCPDLDAVWFLHADSVPPPGWDGAIAEALADPAVVGGAFDFRWDLDGAGPLARPPLLAIELCNRVRFRLSRCYFGDQGIFVRPSDLAAVGGLPQVALLEDVLVCRRLKRRGRLRLARGCTTTSPRRFLRHGVLRQAFLDLALLAAERVGLEPARLHAWYNREGREEGEEGRR